MNHHCSLGKSSNLLRMFVRPKEASWMTDIMNKRNSVQVLSQPNTSWTKVSRENLNGHARNHSARFVTNHGCELERIRTFKATNTHRKSHTSIDSFEVELWRNESASTGDTIPAVGLAIEFCSTSGDIWLNDLSLRGWRQFKVPLFTDSDP